MSLVGVRFRGLVQAIDLCLAAETNASHVEGDRPGNTSGKSRVVASVGDGDSGQAPFHDDCEASGEKQNHGEDRDVEKPNAIPEPTALVGEISCALAGDGDQATRAAM